jgi:sulfate permease, SulP family
MTRGEWWGGLAAMLVALPSSIAFGVVIFTAVSPQLAGSGALAGVVGAAALGIIAPAISRNGGFISSPCAPAAAVMAGVATSLALEAKFPAAHILVLLALTALVSAVLQATYGALRFGRLIKYIPYQVVTGYSCGVAVIIAAAQIPRLLGVSNRRVSDALVSPEAWKWPGIVVGAVTIAVMVLAPRFTKVVPAAILALASGIATYFAIASVDRSLLRMASNSLIIGPIHAAGSMAGPFGAIGRITAADVVVIIGPALTLSLLLSIDTLKTGVLLDTMLRVRHNSDRELIGQGLANAVAALAGGVPGSAGTGPTVVNVTSGGRTHWSGVIEGMLALGVFLAFRDFVAWLPIGALAGILLVIAWRMFDFKIFRLLTVPSTRLDFFVIVVVIVVAASVGLIEATATGVGLTMLIFIRAQLHANVILRKSDLRQTRSKRRRNPDEVAVLDAHGDEGLVVQLRGDLFFGTTDQLFTDLQHDLAIRRFILLDFRRLESMDYTAANLLMQMKQRLAEHNGLLIFSGMPSSAQTQQDMEDYLRKLAIVTGGIGIFDTRDSALEWMEDRILQANGWTPSESKPPLTLAEIPVFHNFNGTWLEELLALIETRRLEPEEKVFSIGDTGDEIFFVRKGRVHIDLPLEAGKRHHLATMCRGDFFGEMSFLDRGPRSANAEAATRTELFALSRSAFDRIDQVLAGRIFEQLAFAIAQRLRVADAELRALEER